MMETQRKNRKMMTKAKNRKKESSDAEKEDGDENSKNYILLTGVLIVE
jgi:hypothetical protein